MMTSCVATPSVASNSIAVVITTAATNPASNPARIAFVRITMPILRAKWRKKIKLHAGKKRCEDASHSKSTTCEIIHGAVSISRSLAVQCVLAWLLHAIASTILSGICCGANRFCAEDSARYSFTAARILRARSTTISEVTCFMQA